MTRLMTVTQVADLLGVGAETVRRYFREGKLPGRKLNKRDIRFTEEDVEQYVESLRKQDAEA